MKNKDYFLVLLAISLILVALFYPQLDGLVISEFDLDEREKARVVRVVDGDTIEVNITKTSKKETVRLLGINTPERGEAYYAEAKNFLNETIHNKTIYLAKSKEDRDLYGRVLRYVYLYPNEREDKESVNSLIVKEGYASIYFPSGKDRYYEKMNEAWASCLASNKRLCEKSEDLCASCIELFDLNVESQEALFYNKCSFSCDLNGWEVKDEGRKKYEFENYVVMPKEEFILKVVKDENNLLKGSMILWERGDYVWTKAGDTLFLRDSKGKLVLYYSY